MAQESEHRLKSGRHYGLDWLRIAAFGLLVFYHIGRVFDPDPWLVKSPQLVAAVNWPMLALEPWRMPLLFAVSGYASWALLSRKNGPGNFLWARSHRLLLPLGLGLLVIIPPETWIGLKHNHGYRESFLHFWTQDWLSFAAVDGVPLPNTEHLWFVAYLWTYTMALGFALRVAPAPWREAARALARRAAGEPVWLLLPLAVLLLFRILLLFTIPETHGLLHDWVSDLVYLPVFLFGFALGATPALWPAIIRVRRPAMVAAAFSLVALLTIEWLYPGTRPHLAQAIDRDAGLVMAWSMILLLLGAAHQWLNRDHPLRARLSEAVFPIYLVHQTIIVAVAWSLRHSGLGPINLFLILLGATFGGCWIFYELGRRAGPLRPLVGLAPASRRRGHRAADTLHPA